MFKSRGFKSRGFKSLGFKSLIKCDNELYVCFDAATMLGSASDRVLRRWWERVTAWWF